MIFFKKRTDKQIEKDIEKEAKRLKKAEHTEKLQSQLKAIKQSQKHLKHERFQRKYGGLIEGLKVAEKETVKGLKLVEKYSKKPTKKRKKSKSFITW